MATVAAKTEKAERRMAEKRVDLARLRAESNPFRPLIRTSVQNNKRAVCLCRAFCFGKVRS